MSDTFTHEFDGWLAAPARRWKNPDGSEGGIVAVTATIHPTAFIAPSAEVRPGANIGDSAVIGEGARIGNGANIGYRANIGDSASIGSGAVIGEGARIGYRANIGDSASIGNRTSIGSGANIGDSAVIGEGARIGNGAEYSSGDWLFVLGPQGSRSALLTAVWSPVHGLRFWVGCKHGLTMDEALAAVDADHGATAHGDDYRYAINTVVNHPGLARAKAEAGKPEQEPTP